MTTASASASTCTSADAASSSCSWGDPEPTESWQHFCLEVDDVKTACETLRSRGLEVTDPHFGEDGSWQCWIQDPDGNRIELHSYTPESKQNVAL